MGRGGFSSHGSAGFRGGSSFGSAPHFGSAPQFGAAFGTGLRQPSLRTRGPFVRGSFGGFRQPVFGSRHFHHRAFFGQFSQATTGITAIPPTTAATYYSSPDYYPGVRLLRLVVLRPCVLCPNDIAQQQQDIDRLEDEVARLREQRETQPPARETPGPQTETPSQPTLLVFRDKHTQEVRTTPLSAARSGFSASSGRPNFPCPGSTSRPPPRPTTIAA